MIAAAAAAELVPGLVAVLLRDGRDTPVLVHDGVFPALLEAAPHAEAGFIFQQVGQPVLLSGDGVGGAVVNGQFHPAGDVHADRGRNDGVVHGQDTSDGQTVARVGIRHERARHGDRQRAGVGHLFRGLGFESLAPLPPRGEFRARQEGGAAQGSRQRGAEVVGEERRRVGDDLPDLRFQCRADAALADEVPHPLVGDAELPGENPLARLASHLKLPLL